MSMKKPAVLLALVGACALAVTGPATLAAPPTPAQPDQGTSASSLPVGDLDTALTSKNGETATPDTDVTVSGQDPARLVGIIGLFAFEGVGVLGGDSACRGRVGVEVFR